MVDDTFKLNRCDTDLNCTFPCLPPQVPIAHLAVVLVIVCLGSAFFVTMTCSYLEICYAFQGLSPGKVSPRSSRVQLQCM
jgi:hypothetical protein